MNIETLFEMALHITSPWYISSLEFIKEKNV